MIDNKIKRFIKNHALENLSEEICGFVVEDKNEIICIKCANAAENKSIDFQISLEDYLNAKSLYNILYIYHSHVDDSDDFSEKDKLYSNEICINYILYHLKSDTFKVYESKDLGRKYIGRFYKHKKYDCFTLIKDYCKQELNIDLKYDTDFFDNASTDVNVLEEVEKYYSGNNFTKILDQNLKKNDILLLNGVNKTPNHFAVYLDDNKILHQPINSFSRIDNYCNFYKRNTVGVYRRI